MGNIEARQFSAGAVAVPAHEVPAVQAQLQRLEGEAQALRDAVAACTAADAAALPGRILRLHGTLSAHCALLAELFDDSTRHAQAANDTATLTLLATFRRSHTALADALLGFLRTASGEGSHLQERMETACASLRSLLGMEEQVLLPLFRRQAEPGVADAAAAPPKRLQKG